MVANWAIASRYDFVTRVTTPRISLAEKERERPAISKLAARRLTSHSNGPVLVSSKSLMSKIRARSGAANAPKFERWASPHACTRSPLSVETARSAAMITAAPR